VGADDRGNRLRCRKASKNRPDQESVPQLLLYTPVHYVNLTVEALAVRAGVARRGRVSAGGRSDRRGAAGVVRFVAPAVGRSADRGADRVPSRSRHIVAPAARAGQPPVAQKAGAWVAQRIGNVLRRGHGRASCPWHTEHREQAFWRCSAGGSWLRLGDQGASPSRALTRIGHTSPMRGIVGHTSPRRERGPNQPSLAHRASRRRPQSGAALGNLVAPQGVGGRGEAAAPPRGRWGTWTARTGASQRMCATIAEIALVRAGALLGLRAPGVGGQSISSPFGSRSMRSCTAVSGSLSS
jgi:hypothetical protein